MSAFEELPTWGRASPTLLLGEWSSCLGVNNSLYQTGDSSTAEGEKNGRLEGIRFDPNQEVLSEGPAQVSNGIPNSRQRQTLNFLTPEFSMETIGASTTQRTYSSPLKGEVTE